MVHQQNQIIYLTAEVKYRRTKKGVINTHTYYHCNRIKDYECKEPYITEAELIKQLIILFPETKLHITYPWEEFNDEIERLNHLKGILNKGQQDQISLTPHNTNRLVQSELSIEQITMLRQYILRIFQFGTPEERLKILSGIESRFELTKSKLELK